MKIVWRKKAADELESIYSFIEESSPQNALKVFNAIFGLTESLAIFPLKFPVEPIYGNEKVRFAVIYSYKVIYAVNNESVVILRIFHTKQHPGKLRK